MLTHRSERVSLNDFAHQPIALCGHPLVADQSGALYWPAERALIVADLHLEKGSSLAHRGKLLPPYDSRATLLKLARVIDRYNPEVVVLLGDSLHRPSGADTLPEADLEILKLAQEGRHWIWVRGNHDPEIGARLGGEVASEVTVADVALRHEPKSARVTHEIAGHLHPAARISLYGRGIRRPCFIGNGRRLVMPAFGVFTGGLNVLDDAFLPIFGYDGFKVWMLGEEGLYPVATRQLGPD